MNLANLHQKLIAAARSTPLDERVPYAFEKRIMARLAGQSAVDPWNLWGRALSRAAACCVAGVLLLSIGSFFLPSAPASTPDSLSQEVEQTLLVSVVNNNSDQETW